MRVSVDRPGSRPCRWLCGSYRMSRRMPMVVMCVVQVPVLMLDFFVLMLMFVPLGEMQRYAEGHQRCGNRQIGRERLAEDSASAIVAPTNGAV